MDVVVDDFRIAVAAAKGVRVSARRGLAGDAVVDNDGVGVGTDGVAIARGVAVAEEVVVDHNQI